VKYSNKLVLSQQNPTQNKGPWEPILNHQKDAAAIERLPRLENDGAEDYDGVESAISHSEDLSAHEA
jgi:hypothetical protein